LVNQFLIQKHIKELVEVLHKSIPGYYAVEEGLNVAGVPGEVAVPGLIASGFADTATGRAAFQGAGIKNLLGRGAVKAVSFSFNVS
jgi:hypothetical protein